MVNNKNIVQLESRDNLERYFKIGVSDDYILLQDDFPIGQISAGDFLQLITRMFRRNDEVRRHGQ
jgi:hypothetical protein